MTSRLLSTLVALAALLASMSVLQQCFVGFAGGALRSGAPRVALQAQGFAGGALRSGAPRVALQAQGESEQVTRRQEMFGAAAALASVSAFASSAAAEIKLSDEDLDAAEFYMSTSRARSVSAEIFASMEMDPVPNDSGDPKKHVPQVQLTKDGGVVVTIPHVMDPGKEKDGEAEVGAHYIEYVWLADEKTGRLLGGKAFDATDPAPPVLATSLPKGTVAVPYAFCNLHGLWKGEKFTV